LLLKLNLNFICLPTSSLTAKELGHENILFGATLRLFLPVKQSKDGKNLLLSHSFIKFPAHHPLKGNSVIV
jgi:hypothetical protein